MSCVSLNHRFEPYVDSHDPLSWTSIAATVRTQAAGLAPQDAEDLLSFADLLDSFSELEKR